VLGITREKVTARNPLVIKERIMAQQPKSVWKDPKATAEEIDDEVFDLDDILGTPDARWASLLRHQYAMKGVRMSLSRLIRSLDRIIGRQEIELSKLASKHRLILTEKQRQKLNSLTSKYANAEFSATMRSMFQKDKKTP